VLPLNSMVTDSVNANQYDYWVAYVPNVNVAAATTCNLTITVTPQLGDPDLFVSPSLQFPTGATCSSTVCKFSQAVRALQPRPPISPLHECLHGTDLALC
jgi:hypothetical protein